ncbi:tRNA pseudouridine(13) synthase TruD [Thermococcus sibiricus]|uniref:Probable tRNA pseudouridine synthase D n=1 Tax=Thermococcus sibiricus (strain DSM 12597 / MM 739) TaxID=604354 RepID=TRUD_THESM|nr:tRNA pseudouridine(13) synthase TruD [Thermococcus sibiricus]C6A1K9.1 RecName: Full=Probable tRNA pseudouridine synthase D; AltName: Full=tRNA pseudouridine(13) synthase; AltName: Full=tRNA pseudouridylate synthase D; AltName: Full=tRNA-uridine isomerase D [Thermococcus sibiricus MM 739]ACS89504.1 Probable tRNA pseudouridine synthase D [Thermococcus sibiricus MM 739]
MDYKQFFSNFRYLSSSKGIGGKIKSKPEDFIVREVIPRSVFRSDQCLIYLIKKQNWETMAAIKEIAKRIGIDYKNVGFAGTKDRHAITYQYISICSENLESIKESIASLNIEGISLKFVGRGKPLKLGMLIGNHFQIILRGLEDPERALERTKKILKELKLKGGFPNYFGSQRFGERRVINHEVGKLLLKGDFEGAALKFLGEYTGDMTGDEARKDFLKTGDVEKALEEFPNFLRYERAMLYKYRETRSWKKAFAVLPRPIVRIFIHSYQSYLFNKALSRRIEEGLSLNEALSGDIVCQVKKGLPIRNKTFKVTERSLKFVNERVKRGEAMVTGPVFGFASRLADGPMGKIEREILDEEGIDLNGFKMKQLPILAEAGGRRELLIKPRGFKYKSSEEGLIFRFFLPKGVYATSVMREIMKDH